MRRTLRVLALITGGLALLLGLLAPAASATESGTAASLGKTRVAIDPDVLALLQAGGLTVAPTGDATAGPFRGTIAAYFPITNINDDGTVFKHSGGVKISGHGRSLSVKNLVVNAATGVVKGYVSGSEIDPGVAAVFKLTDSTKPRLGDFSLLLTNASANAFNDTFGAGVSAGDTFGYATVKPKS